MQCYVKVTDSGAPLEDSQVIIDHESFNDTIQGALIIFHCDNSRTAMCGRDGEWFPNPVSSKEIECNYYNNVLTLDLSDSNNLSVTA